MDENTTEELKRIYARAVLIATKKNTPQAGLTQLCAKMLPINSISELIEQCSKTAREHGFWDAHLDKACEKAGVSTSDYADWFAAEQADIPDEDECPEVHQALTKARARGLALSEKTKIKCEVLHSLGFHGVIGDPFVFLGLIAVEVSEAMESCRKDNWVDADGVFEELADVVIRIFDFIGRFWAHPYNCVPATRMTPDRFLDIIKAKMAVNESRPHRHGKAF